jgi:small subunit ribosomal protein S6
VSCLPAAVPCPLKPLGERDSPPPARADRPRPLTGALLVWPAPMPLYDLMLLLDPGAPSDRHDTILKEVTGLLEGGGTIVTTQEWGTRRMAFEIDHRPEADYHLLQFETENGGALLEQVDHSLKIMDGVLRHRIIRQKDGNVPPPAPRAEGRYAEAPPISEGAPAGETAAAPSEVAAPEAAPAADSVAPADGADPGANPAVADAAPAAEPAAAVETAAPDGSSLPPDAPAAPEADAAPAGDEEASSGPAAA